MAIFQAGFAADFGKLILRVTLSLLILFHGVSKIIHGIDFIIGMIGKAGLMVQFVLLMLLFFSMEQAGGPNHRHQYDGGGAAGPYIPVLLPRQNRGLDTGTAGHVFYQRPGSGPARRRPVQFRRRIGKMELMCSGL